MGSPVRIAIVWLSLCLATVQAAVSDFEYPSALLDLYDAGQSCWLGMGVSGQFPVRAEPAQWLVGPPPSEYTAVTLPADEWVDLSFSGRLVPHDGNDIELLEWGRAGEQALVFLTDGDAQEYLVGLAKALNTGGQLTSQIDLKYPAVPLPFAPRALRVVALDDKGSSPGFDLASVRAWVSHDCDTTAQLPNPVSGALRVLPDAKLNWTSACRAREHIVYLAADESQVRAAAQEAWKGRQTRDANVFDPGGLTLGRTYYWRIDEVLDDNSVAAGPVWRFTVDDHLLVDDFESYDTEGWSPIDSAWVTPGAPPYGSNRASLRLATQSVWHSCRQSMTFQYYYDAGSYSEVYRLFRQPQDWARVGVRSVRVWVYGAAGNATAGELYVSVYDSHGGRGTVPLIIPDNALLTQPVWTACRASLAGFSSVDLNDVSAMGVGLRLPSGVPNRSYAGTINVDDITLYPPLCLDSRRPAADTNGDCVIDYKDVRQMASQWLAGRTNVYPISEPNMPILWYAFDGDTLDSAGAATGLIEGRPAFVTGKHGQAIAFRNVGDVIEIPPENIPDLFASTREAITIAFWQVGDDSPHLNDTICCSDYGYGQSDPSIAINLGCWKNPGQYRWDCGTPWSFANRVAGAHHDKLEWTGRWNHWAFTKDIRVGPAGARGRMEIYLNGVLYDSRTGTDAPIEGIKSFEIGRGWYGRYDGLLDDFQIYDYALSAPEVAYLASDGTGVLEATLPLAADLDYNGFVDFSDYARLASQWLTEGLWP